MRKRFIEIPLYQTLSNKINAKQSFNHKFTDNLKRYIVSTKSIYKGRNPSIWFELVVEVKRILDNQEELGTIYSSFGGYLSSNGNYYLDFNKSFNSLSVAIKIAKAYGQEAIYDMLEDRVIFIR